MASGFWRMDERFSVSGARIVRHQCVSIGRSAQTIFLRFAGSDQRPFLDYCVYIAHQRMVNVKKINRSGWIILILLLFLILLPNSDRVNACATAPAMNRTVEVAEETALIICDAKAGIEHFIRRATFRSDAPDFGFLVPTPSVPELVQEPDSIFVRMEDLMRPQL